MPEVFYLTLFYFLRLNSFVSWLISFLLDVPFFKTHTLILLFFDLTTEVSKKSQTQIKFLPIFYCFTILLNFCVKRGAELLKIASNIDTLDIVFYLFATLAIIEAALKPSTCSSGFSFKLAFFLFFIFEKAFFIRVTNPSYYSHFIDGTVPLKQFAFPLLTMFLRECDEQTLRRLKCILLRFVFCPTQ